MVNAVAARGVPQGRHGVLTFIVGKRNPVIFVQIEAAFTRPVDVEDEGVEGPGIGVVAHALFGDKRAFANKHRRFIHTEVRAKSRASGIALAAEEIDPLTRWKIDALIAVRVKDRSNKHLLPEEVFVRVAVSLFELRVLEVERPQYRDGVAVREPRVGIEIRNE